MAQQNDNQEHGIMPLPTRKFLTANEAAAYLGLSVDSFRQLGVPYYDLGPRTKRWNVDEIDQIVHNRRCSDSVLTTAIPTQKGERKCVSTSKKAHQTGGQVGTIKAAKDVADLLELPING